MKMSERIIAEIDMEIEKKIANDPKIKEYKKQIAKLFTRKRL